MRREHDVPTEDYRRALIDKLVEEVTEAQAAAAAQLVEEEADVEEVIWAICSAFGIEQDEVTTVCDRKRSECGGFQRRLFLQ